MRTILLLTCLLSFVSLAEADEELTVDHDAPLLASDLNLKKWVVSIDNKPDRVLSLVHVVSIGSNPKNALAFETLKYSATKKKLSGDMLIGHPDLLRSPTSIAVRSPSGSTNTYKVGPRASVSNVTISELPKLNEYQLVGSVTYEKNGQRQLKILMLVKVGELKDYRKLNSSLKGIKDTASLEFVQDFEQIPQQISRFLD